MIEYPKINTIFKRDNKGKILMGEFSTPEIKYLIDNKWIWSEKIDGTNIRVEYKCEYRDEPAIIISGKADKSVVPDFLLDRLREIFTFDKLAQFKKDMILFGEGYGNKIQKIGNQYIEDGVDFILFDVRIGSYWLSIKNMAYIANKLNINMVPFFFIGNLLDAVDYVRYTPPISNIGFCTIEGLVLRPQVEMQDRSGNRIMTKIKVRDFKGVK